MFIPEGLRRIYGLDRAMYVMGDVVELDILYNHFTNDQLNQWLRDNKRKDWSHQDRKREERIKEILINKFKEPKVYAYTQREVRRMRVEAEAGIEPRFPELPCHIPPECYEHANFSPPFRSPDGSWEKEEYYDKDEIESRTRPSIEPYFDNSGHYVSPLTKKHPTTVNSAARTEVMPSGRIVFQFQQEGLHAPSLREILAGKLDPTQSYFEVGGNVGRWVDPLAPHYDLSGDFPRLVNPLKPGPKISGLG